MNILVTGAAGYIGSRLCDKLLDSGYRVTGVDNLFCVKQPTLSHILGHKRFRFLKADVREIPNSGLDDAINADLVYAIRSADIIIPLAALVGMPICDKHKVDAYDINCTAIYDMIKLLRQEQIVIYPNTNSSYGTTAGDSVCTEKTPTNAISLYAKAKDQAEKDVLAHPSSVVFRLATVFGVSPRMRLDLLVNDWAYQARFWKYLKIYEPNFQRNYVHIDDVVDAFLFAVSNWRRMRQQVYNLGCDKANMSKLELANKINEYFPCSIEVVEGQKDPDQRNYIVSSEKLAKTGFIASRDLDVGLPQLASLFETFPREHERLYRIRQNCSNADI